jgi:hypothetical protein
MGDSEHQEWLEHEMQRRKAEQEHLAGLLKRDSPKKAVEEDKKVEDTSKDVWTEPTDDDEYYE